MSTHDHFQMSPRRKAEYFSPPNQIKQKVGSGGLTEDILSKAQALIENNSVDFRPIAEIYLESMQQGINLANQLKPDQGHEEVIEKILVPGMQLKANGGMFHYDLITRIADKFIQFMEVVEKLDADALEIIVAFHTTIRAILMAEIKGDGGKRGEELMQALVDACYRYFHKSEDARKII